MGRGQGRAKESEIKGVRIERCCREALVCAERPLAGEKSEEMYPGSYPNGWEQPAGFGWVSAFKLRQIKRKFQVLVHNPTRAHSFLRAHARTHCFSLTFWIVCR
jgi:hypothetical protein